MRATHFAQELVKLRRRELDATVEIGTGGAQQNLAEWYDMTPQMSGGGGRNKRNNRGKLLDDRQTRHVNMAADGLA